MSSLRGKYQIYICPEDFQLRLTDVGGVNIYDEPNFLVVWSQGGGEHALYRAGGSWEAENCPSYTGYRDLLIGGGVPCWALLQWHKAAEYGTPELYYVHNYDEASGLQTLGEYPYRGRYQLLYNLRWVDKTQDNLRFEAMPLSSYLLENIIPIIIQAREISWEKTKALMLDAKEREDKENLSLIEDAMRNSAVPFGGNLVSYGKQGCRTSLVDKKIYEMQKNWNKMVTNARALGRGLSSHSSNPTI